MFSKFDPRRSSAPFGEGQAGQGLPGQGPGPGPAPGFAQGTLSPRIDRTDDPLEVPIGQSALIARTLAGVGALGIAWLMFASGSALTGFFPYLLMVFYVGSGLWTLATARNEIIVKQFAIEIILLVFISATARLLYPQVFAADHNEEQFVDAAIQPNKYEGYLVRSEALSKEFEVFLKGNTFENAPAETEKAGEKTSPENAEMKPSQKNLERAWKEVQVRYKGAVRSTAPNERQKGFQMHESYRHAQDIYDTMAPEIRRIVATRKAGRDIPMVLAGPVIAKSKEFMPLWKASLIELETRGQGH